MRPVLLVLLFLTVCCTCARAQMRFQEVAAARGFADGQGFNYALAVVDYDGDGREDLFVSRNVGRNRLYRQLADGTFRETTAAAGLAATAELNTFNAMFGDLDNDGDPDLYLGNRLANDRLFRNDGGVFIEITATANIDNPAAPRSVNFSDVDHDGDLDIYVVNFGADNQLYVNQGNLTFREVAAERGATDANNRLGMAAVFFDFDGDRDDDLYLVHDGNQPNLMLRNDGQGRFTPAPESRTDIRSNGMGVVAGDLTGDGLADLYVTNLGRNILLVNEGNGIFRDAGPDLGDGGMGWGTSLLDFDNDGLQDLYVVNDSYFSPFPNLLYRQTAAGRFESVGDLSQEGSPYGGITCVAPDLNADGRPDLVVGNTGRAGPLQYFENTTVNDHHWLRVRLRGNTVNRDATGARLRLYAGGQQQLRIVTAGSGYAGQESRWQHFGLGTNAGVDSLRVEWPGGTSELLFPRAVDRSIEVTQGSGLVSRRSPVTPVARHSYPNPVRDHLYLTGHRRTQRYRITDAFGRLRGSGSWPAGTPLRLPNLVAGVYQVTLTDHTGRRSLLRIIKN